MHRRLVKLAVASASVLALAIPASASAAQRAYFADFNADQVKVFNIGSDGGLTLPSPFPGAPTGLGSGLEGAALTPDGDRFFTSESGDLASFPVNTSTGELGAPQVVTADAGLGIVVTPDGRFVYAADGDISGFNLAGDGSIGTAVPGSPVAIGTGNITGLAVSPDGKFLYGANEGSSTIQAFSIGSDGKLTELAGSPYPTANFPYPLSISPDGKHLYVPGRTGTPHQVFSYNIAADGSLSQTAGSPLNMAGGVANAFGSTVTADGKYFFTANYATGNLSGFKINADGSLTELTGSPFAVGSNLGSITSDSSGTHLYVTNDNGQDVYVFALASDGTPSAVAGSPFATGTEGDFQAVALTPVPSPVASLTYTRSGRAVSFDATGTTDPLGGIVNYTYDYGDGTTASTPSARPTHTYAPGTYTATMVPTSSTGCSGYSSSGQTAFCTGGANSKASVTFTVPRKTTPDKPKLKVKAKKKQKLGKAIKLKVSSQPGTRISVPVTKVRLKGASEKSVEYKAATITVKQSGKGKLKLKISKKDAAIAKGATSGKAKVKVTARGTGGKASQKLKITLK